MPEDVEEKSLIEVAVRTETEEVVEKTQRVWGASELPPTTDGDNSEISSPSPVIQAEEVKAAAALMDAPVVVTSSTMVSLVAGTRESHQSTVAGTTSTSTAASSSTGDVSMEVLREAVERAKRRQAAAES